jgi:hypothetical protein
MQTKKSTIIMGLIVLFLIFPSVYASKVGITSFVATPDSVPIGIPTLVTLS